MRKILLKALFCTSALAIPQTTLAQELDSLIILRCGFILQSLKLEHILSVFRKKKSIKLTTSRKIGKNKNGRRHK